MIDATLNDLSLQPVVPMESPGETYAARNRLWQGIPGIEQTRDGRLWATWYSGGKAEGPDNYVLLVSSRDDGCTWSEPLRVIDPPDKVRAYDPCLWTDPLGRLWHFWAQSYEWFDGRCGVWASRCDAPDAGTLRWTPPRRLAHGIMMNKPTVLSTGEWLMPAAIWDSREPRWPQFESERKSNVFCSRDQGETWTLLGSADVPERVFDEHMVIERRDGSLWMLVRTKYGIGESVSTDRGRTWSPGQPSDLAGPGSRFFIRRLRSGRLLLVNHYQFTGRSHMTALLSDDDGRTWPHHLLLDERANVSYPDGFESSDGRIYVTYDRERHGAKEILMAVFTQADILTGRCTSRGCRLKELINRA